MRLLALAPALAAYLWLALGYLQATPPWQNPDEPAHFNYVAELAQTGRLPELRPGDYDGALLSRLQNGALLPGDQIASIRYEAWQPPLYYLLAAPVYRSAGQADAVGQLRALRFFDVLLGAATVVLAYLAAGELFARGRPGPAPAPDRPPGEDFPSHMAALAVALAIVGVPMFTAVSSAVTNDALANLLAAALALAVLRLARREPSTRTSLLLGVLLGLALLTKLSLVIFVPAVMAATLFAGWRASTRGVELAGAVLLAPIVALAMTLPWLTRQVLTYGWGDPLAIRRHDLVVGQQQLRFAGVDGEVLRAWATTSFHSFWAQFGWMAMPAPDRLYWAWGLVCLAALAGLAWGLARGRGSFDAGRLWLLALIVLGSLAGYVAYNLAFVQYQGRYLFSALVPLGVLLVIGWGSLLPRPLRSLGVLLLAAALVALNAYTLTRFLMPAFAAT